MTLNSRNSAIWQHRWHSGDLGRFCYSVTPNIKIMALFKKCYRPLCRTTLRTTLRIVANHYTLNLNHLHRFNITDTALCQCGQYQTVDYILFACTIYTTKITKLQNQLFTDDFTGTFESRHILATTTSANTIKIN